MFSRFARNDHDSIGILQAIQDWLADFLISPQLCTSEILETSVEDVVSSSSDGPGLVVRYLPYRWILRASRGTMR